MKQIHLPISDWNNNNTQFTYQEIWKLVCPASGQWLTMVFRKSSSLCLSVLSSLLILICRPVCSPPKMAITAPNNFKAKDLFLNRNTNVNHHNNKSMSKANTFGINTKIRSSKELSLHFPTRNSKILHLHTNWCLSLSFFLSFLKLSY